MKRLSALVLTMIVATSLWASDKTPLETISSRIVEMQTMADNMINSIEINSQGDELKFEDYQQAKSELNNNIEIALTEYRQGLETIKEDLQTNLATYESELQSYKAAYEARGGKALEKAVDDRMKRFSSLVGTLEERLNKSYQSMLIKLMTLNGKFTFPGKRKLHPHNFIYLGLGAAVGLVAAPYVFGAGATAGAIMILSGGSLTVVSPFLIVPDFVGYHSEGFSGRSKLYDNTGRIKSKGWGRYRLEESIEKSGNKIFGKCETAGCVYLLSEDLKDTWAGMKKLNSNLKLWEGFKLKKIKAVSNHLANKRIDEMAKVAAKTKTK